MAPAPGRPGFFRRALVIVGRAFRRRCPNCGSGGIFTTWFAMSPTCPSCGLALQRNEQGYQVGAYMLNIAVAELVFVALLVGTLVATWPDPPWRALTFGGAALVLILPVFFYPFSKTLFLGLDLLFNPSQPSDYGAERRSGEAPPPR